MTAKRSNGHGFMDRHLATIVMVSLVFAGQIAGYAILQNKVGGLEDRTKDNVNRSEHTDLLRRTEILERELVPRSEHQLRDAELNKRLDVIHEDIKEIRDKVEIIDNRQRGIGR